MVGSPQQLLKQFLNSWARHGHALGVNDRQTQFGQTQLWELTDVAPATLQVQFSNIKCLMPCQLASARNAQMEAGDQAPILTRKNPPDPITVVPVTPRRLKHFFYCLLCATLIELKFHFVACTYLGFELMKFTHKQNLPDPAMNKLNDSAKNCKALHERLYRRSQRSSIPQMPWR